MASEREKLEAALGRLSSGGWNSFADATKIIDAARKYLETLPKTVKRWKVTYAPSITPGARVNWSSNHESFEAALEFAHACHEARRNAVSIEEYDAPA